MEELKDLVGISYFLYERNLGFGADAYGYIRWSDIHRKASYDLLDDLDGSCKCINGCICEFGCECDDDCGCEHKCNCKEGADCQCSEIYGHTQIGEYSLAQIDSEEGEWCYINRSEVLNQMVNLGCEFHEIWWTHNPVSGLDYHGREPRYYAEIDGERILLA